MDPETLRAVAEEHIPFNKFLGMRVDAVEHGKVRLRIPFRPELVGNPMTKAIHGGVISALADAAGGLAVWSAVTNAALAVSTIDLRIDFLRPGKMEDLVAEGVVLRASGRVGFADIRLFHESRPGDTVATGRGVYAIKPPSHPAPKKEP